MQIFKSIQTSLQDLNAFINIYENEIIINKDVSLINVTNQSVELYYHHQYVTIIGDDLSIVELTNITKIKGTIKKVIYEIK